MAACADVGHTPYRTCCHVLTLTIIITLAQLVCLSIYPRNGPLCSSEYRVDTAAGTGLDEISSVLRFLSIWHGYKYRSTCELEMCGHFLLTMSPMESCVCAF